MKNIILIILLIFAPSVTYAEVQLNPNEWKLGEVATDSVLSKEVEIIR